MEYYSRFPLSLTSTIALLVPAIIFLLIKKLNKSRKAHISVKLPPGPKTLPIIGHLHLMSKLPFRSFRHLAEQFGPIMLLKFCEVPIVVVSSPEIAKLILKDNDPNYADRPESIVTKILWYANVDIVFCQYGEYWRQTLSKPRLLMKRRKLDAILDDIINEHKENLAKMAREIGDFGQGKDSARRGNGEFGNEDLVDVLLRIKENGELEFPIGNDNIKVHANYHIVGSLMYAMACTRPDIAHAVGVVSRFLSNPGKDHWSAVKWILRYLRGTSKYCLKFGDDQTVLDGFTDADMAGDIDSRKSTSGYLMRFAGGAISWQSKLQKCVALSTTEAEYIAVTEACKEMLWLKKFLHELDLKQEKYTLYCDSQSAIHLSKNSSFHSRSKHIDVRYHWIRDVLDEKLMQLDKVHTDENGADMLTKSLPRDKFEACRSKAGYLHSWKPGTETSSTTIDWAMAELMRNPRIMAKAQAEVREVFKGSKIIEENDVQKLKYLKLVIKETFRLHSPLPLLLRASREEREINGYIIPAKTKVFVNTWAMQRDPKYWTNPEVFEPERFENLDVDFVGSDFHYLPFGAGKRMCPGMAFGLANVELPLAQFLYSFDWKLPDGGNPESLDMIENTGLTAARKNNLFVIPTPYESLA